MFEIFKTVLLLSAAGVSATLILLALKPLALRKFPAMWQRNLWIVAAAMFATIAFASIDGLDIKNGTLIVNGKEQGIDIVYIETQKTSHTDSFYVPLRETFESLGYAVHYDANKSKYAARAY